MSSLGSAMMQFVTGNTVFHSQKVMFQGFVNRLERWM